MIFTFEYKNSYMPEEGAVIAAEPIANEPVLSAEQLAWKQQMDYQFMNDIPAPATPIVNDGNEPAPNEPSAPSAPVIDYTPFIKENFGIENIDDFKAKWTALQALEANPPKPVDQEFVNEESKKAFELARTGKFKELNEIISQQLKIEELVSAEVTDLTVDEIIKLGMQIESKELGLTQREIDLQFKKQFLLPKEPDLDIYDEDSVAAHNEWKEQVEEVKLLKSIAAKKMKPQLEAAKTKIQFPDILSTQSSVDPDYEAYKARNANVSQQVDTMITPAIKALKESDVQLGFKVSDPNNQMDFDVSIAPTPEAFEKARQDSLSFDNWFQNLCYDKDGKFQPQNVQKLILLYNERGNYDLSIARQAVNAERARVIAKETGNNGNNGKNYNVNVGERSELQKQMDERLS